MTQGGSAPPSQQPQLMQAPAQPVKPRGAFGRQNPSFWQWLTLGPEAPDVLQQRRMRDMQMSALEQQQKLQSQGQTDLNSAIGQLPPEMQPFARVAPEAAIGAMFRQERAPPEPHYDSTTGNFWGVDPRTGEPRIMGRMPGWRPTQGAGGDRAPPSGYRFTQDGNLEPIPGGPADERATAAGRSRIAQMDASLSSLDNAIGVLSSAEGHVNGWNTGLGGQMFRGMGGTSAYNLNAELEPVRAILSFENLAEMRRNSQTGGALGSIAVRELELLGSTVRSLDTAQGEQQMRQALRDVRAQLQRTRSAVEAARREAAGESPSPAPRNNRATIGGRAFGGTRVIDLEPSQ